jgi:Type II secretion system (T2SS), protein F
VTTAVAVTFAALAGALAVSVPRAPRRLSRILDDHGGKAANVDPAAHAVWVVSAAAVLIVGATISPWFGVCAGALALGLGRRRAHAPPELDVPLVADLLAACFAAGATATAALRAAGNASPEAAELCLPVAAHLAAGVAPHEAWASWLHEPELAAIARACVRAADSGAAMSAELRRAGDRARVKRRAELHRRVQRAGVWAVLPLGVCFLPAFVLVGIVPFALGLFGR